MTRSLRFETTRRARRASPWVRLEAGVAVFVAWSVLVLAPFGAMALPPNARDAEALRQVAQALNELRVEEAARLLTPLARAYPDDSDVRFERAMVRFYQGDYGGAVSDLEAAGASGRLRDSGDRAELGALIEATHRATEHFLTARSPDGRYVVRHAPGPDAVLVPYAIEAMEAADRELREELGVQVPGPLRLEIYPTASSLAQVSTLTVEEIGRTGTIALCKWDRIMVTSPRALVRGYPWMDTIGHELVHLFLSRASRDRAPVWMQEGIAKFLERRWRGEPGAAHLDPASEALLQGAVRSGALLPFDRLHPSIARLDSQEEAALAFAQVATFVEVFYREHGPEGLRGAVARVADGSDAREAMGTVAGGSFDALERRWRRALRERPAPTDAPALLPLRLRRGHGEADDSDEVEQEQARRHLRLGDLLWDRERPRAASIEYGRAHAIAPDDPIIASRHARAALAGGRPEAAVEALASFRERYPDHEPTWAVSGAAWLALGDLPNARSALREAIRLNPFDPQPHCDLVQVLEDGPERTREREACELLGSPPRSR